MSGDKSQPIRIVAFEDNAADVHLLREALAENNVAFQLEVYDDGDQVQRYLAAGTERPPVDVFVIDLNLPKITGDEILSCIRRDKSLSEVPALVLTSSDSRRDRTRAFELGATDYLRKPCTLDEYFEIGRVIERLVRPAQPDAPSASQSGEA
jgi:two-component system, chemotaxis family, response regulator Rcp1